MAKIQEEKKWFAEEKKILMKTMCFKNIPN